MSVVEVVNVVASFVIATGPVALTVGAIGHALVASRWPAVQRVGKFLEGVGFDWKRVAESIKGVKK